MPDSSLYWYGNKIGTFLLNTIPSMDAVSTYVSYVESTNYITLHSYIAGIDNTYSVIIIDIKNYNSNSVNIRYGNNSNINRDISSALIAYTAENNTSWQSACVSQSADIFALRANEIESINVVSNSNYVYVATIRQAKSEVEAIWLE